MRGARLGSLALMVMGLVCGGLVQAEEASGAPPPDLAVSTWKSLGALLLVLVLIFLLAWLARRYLHFLPQVSNRGGEGIQIVASKTLGPKRALFLVEVGNCRLLLGSSETGLRLIKDFSSKTEMDRS